MVDDPRAYLIADFDGVHALSGAAAKELFVQMPPLFFRRVEPINMDPIVARTVSRVLRYAGSRL